MNNLYIIDVSAVIYGGNASYTDKNIKGLPVGGLLGLTKWIGLAFADNDSVILAFDDKESFRKELFSGYKAGRTRNPMIDIQRKMAEELMLSCGIQPHKVSKMEADDIIAWAANEFENSYREIFIVTNDMDAAHLVRNGISVRAVNSLGTCVKGYNFETVVVFGETVKFNTIAVHKMLFGCSSDKIPAFKHSGKKPNTEIYADYCRFLTENNFNSYEETSSVMTFAKFIQQCEYLTEEDEKALFLQAQLVYPGKRPDDFRFTVATKNTVDQSKLCQIFSVLNDTGSLKCLGMWKQDIQPMTWRFFDEYRDKYISGEFSVDRNLPLPPSNIPDSFELDADMLKEF